MSDLPNQRAQVAAQHSPAMTIKRQLQERSPAAPAELLHMPLPSPRVWRIITDVAEAGVPWIEANKRLMGEYFHNSDIRGWPTAWSEEIDDSLPAVSRQEALAVLERFLKVNSGGLHDGVRLYAFQWVALVSVYCPAREHYRALREMVDAGLLRESAEDVVYYPSRLRFPLIITQESVEAINALKRRAKVERSHVGRRWLAFETWHAERAQQYPVLMKAIGTVAKDAWGRLISFVAGAAIAAWLS